MGRGAITGLAAALALAALGCGGSDSDEPDKPVQPPVSPTTAGLPKPFYPSCGVESFGPPRVTRAGPGGWRLFYALANPPQDASSGRVTTQLSLDERPPDSQRVRYANARTIEIAGRRVDIFEFNQTWTAQWVTKRARYVGLSAGGGNAVLKRVVRCTP